VPTSTARKTTVTAPQQLPAAPPRTSTTKTTAPTTPSGGGGSFSSCKAAKAAGAAPLYRGQPGYSSKLDRDDDGVACER
jgi:hypothetical protein